MLKVTPLLLAALLVGCAAKKHTALPLDNHVHIKFANVHDGKCEIAEVLRDAQPKHYTVVCK